MPGLATLIAANPRPRQRPTRYVVAILVAAVLVVVMIANSVLDFAYLDTIPGRTSLYGLLAVALVALATYVGVRAFDRDPKTRARHLVRAGVLLGLAALLWLLFSDVFLFAGSAGPGVAVACTLACVPTTAFGLFVGICVAQTNSLFNRRDKPGRMGRKSLGGGGGADAGTRSGPGCIASVLGGIARRARQRNGGLAAVSRDAKRVR